MKNSGNLYIDNEIDNSEKLIGDESESVTAFAAHALQKAKARERMRQDRKHSEEETPYRQQRRKTERDLGHVGTSTRDIRDKMTDEQAIKQELSDYGVNSVDELSKPEEFLSEQEVFKRFGGLFGFLGLGENIECTPGIVERYGEITDRKEQLEFISGCSLPDKVRLFCSKKLGYSNYDYFMNSLQLHQDFINGEAVGWSNEIGDYVDDDGLERLDLERLDHSKSISTGLNRASLRAAMIGTPEYGAYKMASDIIRDEGRTETSDFPKVSGYWSGIFWGGRDIGDWATIIDEYDTIAGAVARRNPDMDEKSLEHKTVREVARIFAESTKYNAPNRGPESPYVSSFQESIIWAQLGDGAKRQLRGMRQKICDVDLHNIGRFIGKSGYSQKRRSLEAEARRLVELEVRILDAPDDEKQEILASENESEIKKQEEWREKEIVRIKHKYEKLIGRTRSEERRATYVERQEEEIQNVVNDTSERIDYFKGRDLRGLSSDNQERQALLSRRINKRKSLAEKAIDLHFMRSNFYGCLDWINDAPFGMIKRAHNMLASGVNADEICKSAMREMVRAVVCDPDRADEAMNQMFDDAVANENGVYEILQFMRIVGDLMKERHLGELPYSGLAVLNHTGMTFKELSEGIRNGKIDLDAIEEYPWLMNHLVWQQYGLTNNGDVFPARKSDNAKYKWCSDNSFVWLDGEWGRQTIGKVIFTRLQAGVDETLHDATQWLSIFQIPETGYNVPEIKKRVEHGETINIEDFSMTLFNKDEELNYLARILDAPQSVRDRLKLSTKEQNMTRLFSSPEHIFIYEELTKILKNPEIDFEEFRAAMQGRIEDYYESHIVGSSGKSSGWRMDFTQFVDKVDQALDKISENMQYGFEQTERIGEIAQRLNQYGLNRKVYIDDATSWIVKHTVSPQQSLTAAWGDRVWAIADGTKDSASEINSWSSSKTLIGSQGEYLKENGISGYELATVYGPFVAELTRCYSAEIAARALVEYKKNHNPEKVMPAVSIPVEARGRKFTGEVLAHDDPRGMTIGYDTGCCMTVGGASDSCIRSGYRDAGAGFFAFYGADGRINAQSYFFTNPDYPEIAVMDNIEANQGRDSHLIIDVYQEFFKKYLMDRFSENPNWKIRQINVGTGYGEVAKAQVMRLKSTKIVPNNLSGYSDAMEDQRLLVYLSDAEIARARGDGKSEIEETAETVKPNHSPFPATSPLGVNQLPILRSLESQLYPEVMRQYNDDDFAYEELNMPGIDKYSFLIKVREDAMAEASGYCLAYENDSTFDPSYPDKVVYVADFGILPDARGGMTALKAFNELLRRVGENGVNRIEMDARESTTFRILASDWGRRYLSRNGYDLVIHDGVESFSENEATRAISLQKR